MINSDGKLRPVLADPEGIETRLVDLELRAFARTPYDRLFTELGTLAAAEQALAAGCDALYIDTFGDYAIELVRAVADIPVIGAGETAIAVAAKFGTFSIVTVWPESMAYLYDERLRTCIGGSQCVGVHYFSLEHELDKVGTGTGVKARMRRGDDSLVDQLAAACRAARETDGSDVVLLGCTCMAPIYDALRHQCDFPILEVSSLGQQAAMDAAVGNAPPVDRARTRRAGEASLLAHAWLQNQPTTAVSDECSVCAFGGDNAND
ncbi:MAG: aspartate/glutamate racemase family protein [Antricoccus sp.]